VLPSLYLEAFGMVVAEALSQGVPAIVSQRAGACSLIEHGTNGYVVDMAEPVQLQRACDALMAPPPHTPCLRPHTAATGRRRWIPHAM
jgi:glycosyltransferase involved in cell wall biosynthesis